MKQANRIDKDGYIVEPVIVVDDAEDTEDVIVTPCPDGFFRPRWDREARQWVEGDPAALLEHRKCTKIEELKSACNAAIVSGFQATWADGTTYTYKSDETDQRNLTLRAIAVQNDPSITTVEWETVEAGVVAHSREDFLAVVRACDEHIQRCLARLRELKAAVEAATTVEEIDEITWENGA